MKLPEWLTVAGVVVAVAAIVGLIWIEADAGSSPIGSGKFSVSMGYRWSIATNPLIAMTAGLILVAVAQILRSRDRLSTEHAADWPPVEESN